MEDLEASNEMPGQEMDCDDETSDPSWKPQQLQSEYDKTADDKTQHQEKSEFNTVQPIQFKHILITSLHYYT